MAVVTKQAKRFGAAAKQCALLVRRGKFRSQRACMKSTLKKTK